MTRVPEGIGARRSFAVASILSSVYWRFRNHEPRREEVSTVLRKLPSTYLSSLVHFDLNSIDPTKFVADTNMNSKDWTSMARSPPHSNDTRPEYARPHHCLLAEKSV